MSKVVFFQIFVAQHLIQKLYAVSNVETKNL